MVLANQYFFEKKYRGKEIEKNCSLFSFEPLSAENSAHTSVSVFHLRN